MKVEEHVEAIKQQGYSILHDLLPIEQVDSVKQALAPWLSKEHMGRNDFEGFQTERVYGLLAKLPFLSMLVEHPDVLAIIDNFLEKNYLLTSYLAINIHPGETAQTFHGDHTQVPNCNRNDINGMSALWAFDDFTTENGATEIIPGSHTWSRQEPIPEDAGISVQMSAGSVVVYHGSLYHRGGANNSTETRLALTPQYCQPWLRQLENMPLVVPPDQAGQFSSRIQALLGYSIRDPGFMGFVNGLHPKRLIDENYQGRKVRGIPS